eukprot:m51a1_g12338 putative serine threonine protein kinase (511) ;mRNA; r:502372-505674
MAPPQHASPTLALALLLLAPCALGAPSRAFVVGADNALYATGDVSTGAWAKRCALQLPGGTSVLAGDTADTPGLLWVVTATRSSASAVFHLRSLSTSDCAQHSSTPILSQDYQDPVLARHSSSRGISRGRETMNMGKHCKAERLGVSFSPESIDFGTNLEIDVMQQLKVTVSNTGAEQISLNIVCPFSENYDLRAAPEIVDVPAGGCAAFVMHFKGHCTTQMKVSVAVVCPERNRNCTLHARAQTRESLRIDWETVEITSTRVLEAEGARLHVAKWRYLDVWVKEWSGALDYEQVPAVVAELEKVVLLKSPSIVSTYGIVSLSSRFCLVTEMPPFGTLEQFLAKKDKAMSNELKVKMALDIALGLQSLHEAGIVHGALKPSTIHVFAMLPLKNIANAKVAEFGAANRVVARPEELPLFAAPEVAQGSPATAASDVFSFGLVMCALETGQSPLAAYKSKDQIVEAAGSKELPAPEGPLRDLIALCLKCKSDARPPMSAVVLALTGAYAAFN